MNLTLSEIKALNQMFSSLIKECVAMNNRITALEKTIKTIPGVPAQYNKELSLVKQPEPRGRLNLRLKNLDDTLRRRP